MSDIDDFLAQLEDLDAAAIDEKIAEHVDKIAMLQRLKAVLTGEKIPKGFKAVSQPRKPRAQRTSPSAAPSTPTIATDLTAKKRVLVEFLTVNGPSGWSAMISGSRVGTQALSDLLKDDRTFVKRPDGLWALKHGA